MQSDKMLPTRTEKAAVHASSAHKPLTLPLSTALGLLGTTKLPLPLPNSQVRLSGAIPYSDSISNYKSCLCFSLVRNAQPFITSAYVEILLRIQRREIRHTKENWRVQYSLFFGFRPKCTVEWEQKSPALSFHTGKESQVRIASPLSLPRSCGASDAQ